MTDTMDLEARLASALSEVAASVGEAPPETWEAAKSGRLTRRMPGFRPSRSRRSALVGTGIAAAGLTAALVWSGGGSAVSAQAVAYRTVAAIKSAGDLIEKVQRSIASPEGETRFTVWRYNNSARIETFGAGGVPTTDAAGPLLTTNCGTDACGGVEVVYATRRWFTLPSLYAAPNDDNITPRAQTSADIASLVQKGIEEHTLKIGATETVDGRDVIDLSYKAAFGRTNHIWVDLATYLPLKSIAYSGARLVSTQTYAWLVPTPKNLALLKAIIPAGFAHTSGLPPKP